MDKVDVLDVQILLALQFLTIQHFCFLSLRELILYIVKNILEQTEKAAANKGFAIVGRNCKVQRLFFGSTFAQN